MRISDWSSDVCSSDLSRSNIKEMRVEPSVLRELISLRPAIDPSDCSSGVATLDAMVSGLAPASLAETDIMGKSTCGKGATGRNKKASPPVSTSAAQNSEIGRASCRERVCQYV